MLTIALCDDEAEQRSSIGALLQNYAAARPDRTVKLSVFSSSWDLLSTVEEAGGFSIYVLDVVMPGMGGMALAKELQRRLPGLPVVLASGYSHVLAQEGTHGFELLHKPYSAEQLGRILHQVLGLRSGHRTRVTEQRTS